jgi:hypothetical protein
MKLAGDGISSDAHGFDRSGLFLYCFLQFTNAGVRPKTAENGGSIPQ